jgi:glucokinase
MELSAGGVTAVCVDHSGRVLTRARAAAAEGTLAHAARAAYRAVRRDEAHGGPGVSMSFQASEIPRDVRDAITEAAGAEPVAIPAGHANALAETWCGAAQGCRQVVTLSIADHVTAGILIDGRPLRGANGRAGSVAWMTLNPVERDDYRRRGGLEAEVAAAGIVRRLVWRIKSGDESAVADRVGGDLARLTAADVFAAAREGDGVSVSVIRDTAKYVGMAVANLAAILDPECVVLGGELATAGDLMLEPVRAECARRVGPAHAEHMRIILSALGDEAAAIGAARAAMQHSR